MMRTARIPGYCSRVKVVFWKRPGRAEGLAHAQWVFQVRTPCFANDVPVFLHAEAAVKTSAVLVLHVHIRKLLRETLGTLRAQTLHDEGWIDKYTNEISVNHLFCNLVCVQERLRALLVHIAV